MRKQSVPIWDPKPESRRRDLKGKKEGVTHFSELEWSEACHCETRFLPAHPPHLQVRSLQIKSRTYKWRRNHCCSSILSLEVHLCGLQRFSLSGRSWWSDGRNLTKGKRNQINSPSVVVIANVFTAELLLKPLPVDCLGGQAAMATGNKLSGKVSKCETWFLLKLISLTMRSSPVEIISSLETQSAHVDDASCIIQSSRNEK